MARAYRIRSGCSFRLADGSLKTAGEPIDLDDDVARDHADKLEPVQAPAPGPEAAPEPATDPATDPAPEPAPRKTGKGA
jgi:hypothetical protein